MSECVQQLGSYFLPSVRSTIVTSLSTLVLLACATRPPQPVSLVQDAIGPGSRVGIVMAPIPGRSTQTPGADCLLCMATAALANASLSSHVKSLPIDDFVRVKDEMAVLMRKKDAQVTVVAEELDVAALPDAGQRGPNQAPKDFSSLRQRYSVDKLLVIEVKGVGVVRTYAAYVPTSDPKAGLTGIGYLVDLRTNQYQWLQPVSVTRSAGTSWDEPPAYPGLTNAYFEVLETAKDELLKPFAQVPAIAAQQPSAKTDVSPHADQSAPTPSGTLSAEKVPEEKDAPQEAK